MKPDLWLRRGTVTRMGAAIGHGRCLNLRLVITGERFRKLRDMIPENTRNVVSTDM